MCTKMIEICNVVKHYGTNKNHKDAGHNTFQRPNAVDSINLIIHKNTATLLKGPNGAGKTTLLTIIGGMTRPTSGRVLINKRDISSLPENFLSAIRKRYFGFIFQSNHLIKGISVAENIMLPAYTTGKKPKLIRKQAMSLLEKLKIEPLAKQKVEYLSGGEQQRVAIARSLINDPEIILADEPTAHLHPSLAVEFLQIVSKLIQEGKSVIISSHSSLLSNSGIVDRIIELNEGKVSNDLQMLSN